MKLIINIEKRYAYLIIGVLVFIFGFLVVNAYNSGESASVVGHSAEELDLSRGINGDAIFNENVGIGTTTPGVYDSQQSRLDIEGYASANDVWLKDSNAWASDLSLTIDLGDCVTISVPQLSSSLSQCPAGYVVTGITTGSYGCATGCARLMGSIKCCKVI